MSCKTNADCKTAVAPACIAGKCAKGIPGTVTCSNDACRNEFFWGILLGQGCNKDGECEVSWAWPSTLVGVAAGLVLAGGIGFGVSASSRSLQARVTDNF
jgi:hypothetical protein